MFRVGVVCGSYAGISLRKICTQSAGTGGDLQSAGSVRSPECVGMTIVPSGTNTIQKGLNHCDRPSRDPAERA